MAEKYTDPEWGLKFDNKEEFTHFKQSRRAMLGFWTFMVKHIFPPEAYSHLYGGAYREDEPLGRGKMGPWGIGLRYAAIDRWFMQQRIEKGKVTKDEVLNITHLWKDQCTLSIPLSHEEILDLWRTMREDNKKNTKYSKEREAARKSRKRRFKQYEKQFYAEQNPALIYRRLRSGIPNLTALDEQILRQVARYLANANDYLIQAEALKDEQGIVSVENLQDFAKLNDLHLKQQKEASALMKSYGYDYQARRVRREVQTASEIFDENIAEKAVLFDELAIELLCPKCSLTMGYFLRCFPTVTYEFLTECPRCGTKMEEKMLGLPDEVMDL